MLSEKSQNQTVIWFNLYDVLEKVKTTLTAGQAGQGSGRGDWDKGTEVPAKWCRGSENGGDATV